MNEHEIETMLESLGREERAAAPVGIESRVAAATLTGLRGGRGAAVPDMRLRVNVMRTGVRVAAALGFAAVLTAAWMARTPARPTAAPLTGAGWIDAAAILDEATGSELASLFAEADTLDERIRAGWTIDDAMLSGEAM